MDRPPYPAELYELVHRGTAGDVAFYRRVCAGAKAVLELGCGYGRVLEGLAELPLSLTGLEIDADLLARARARLRRRSGLELVQGDMRAFDAAVTSAPAGGFDRILIPHSGVYCLPDDDACVACFRCCAGVLSPGGRLVLDAYGADAFHRDEDPNDHTDERLDPVVSVELDGASYDVYERSRWDRPAQRLEVTYEYIPRRGGEALQGRLVHRYLLRRQLAPLLAQAGLRLSSLDGDWRGHPSTSESPMWVATAGHAGAEDAGPPPPVDASTPLRDCLRGGSSMGRVLAAATASAIALGMASVAGAQTAGQETAGEETAPPPRQADETGPISLRGGIGFTAEPGMFLLTVEAPLKLQEWLSVGPLLQLGASDDEIYFAPTVQAYLHPRLTDDLKDLRPYAHAGIGLAYLHKDDRPGRDDDGTDFQFTAGLGIEYALRENFFMGTGLLFDVIPGSVVNEKFIFGWQILTFRHAF